MTKQELQDKYDRQTERIDKVVDDLADMLGLDEECEESDEESED